MENFRPTKSPCSDRFLGLYSTPDATGTSGFELHEDEVFWTGNEPPEQKHSPRPPLSMANPNPSPLSPSFRDGGGFRRPSERNFGILAALPEDEKKRAPKTGVHFLQRKPSISSSSTSSASASPTSSSFRMIPAIPKPKPEYSLSMPTVGKIHHQSMPVNVPLVQSRARKGPADLRREGEGNEEDGDDDEMLPPHEIVDRAYGKGSPMTTFSVLEGAGRTLKGRDLRRVRNAVFRQTGFLD